MICVWAAPPTCMSRGLRAYQGVYAHTQGLTCERTMWLSGRYHPGQAPDNVREQPIPPGTTQNADHFATSSPFSVFFTEVVCGLGAPALQTAASPSPVGGNCTTRGSDTPATRRKKASCSAKPPPQPPEVRRIAYKAWHSTGWREKVRPTPPLQWHFREKVRPARPLRRLFREKVLPAHVKTPNLCQFERAGRTFSRFHDLTATQGELFRACRCRPSSALPISDRAPLVWRAPADPESPAAVPAGDGGVLP